MTDLGVRAGNTFGGSTKRAVCMGLFIGVTNLSGAASAFVYLPRFAPYYHKAHAINFTTTTVAALAAVTLRMFFKRENARREATKPAQSYTDGEKMEDREKGDYARFFRYTL
jgi:hypothetical protein